MKRILPYACIFLFYFLITGIIILGDERSEPKDIILALDKSLSMEEEITQVKSFIENAIINRLIKDDYFMVIIFYGRDELAAAKYINDPAIDIPIIKNELSQVLANGPYTDIGNVLDRLREEFTERSDNKRKKECFLITDGINEPTRNSKYYTKNGILKHDLLSNLKDIIVRDNWKVQFLAIGDDTKVETIAQNIDADFHQVEKEATASEIGNTVGDIIGSISIITESILPIIINQNGNGNLHFKVMIDRFQEKPNIGITNIELQGASFSENNLLLSPFFLTLPHQGEADVSIPIISTSPITPGDYRTNIYFTFNSSDRFDKKMLSMILHKNNIFENYKWLLPLIIIGIIAVIVVVWLILNTIIKGKPIVFKVIVKEAPIPEGKNRFKLTRNKELFLNESLDIISLSTKKIRKSIGKLVYFPSGIKLSILNEYRFENIDIIPENILGQNIQIRTLSNKIYNIAFLNIT